MTTAQKLALAATATATIALGGYRSLQPAPQVAPMPSICLRPGLPPVPCPKAVP